MARDDRIEQRRHPRLHVDAPIRISTIDPEVDPWTGRPFFRTCAERVADVSRGGARIQTHEPLAPGRRLLLEIDLPGGPTVEAIARVAWARLEGPSSSGAQAPLYGLGLEFLGGTPEHLARLNSFLQRPQSAHASAA
jgi:hypothetical protein